MPTHVARNRNRVIPFPRRPGCGRLVACSVCLRVRVGGAWIEAAELIRSLRTFDLDDVVRLDAALCERCETELRLRRHTGSDDLAA
jgi:hypothetical protein